MSPRREGSHMIAEVAALVTAEPLAATTGGSASSVLMITRQIHPGHVFNGLLQLSYTSDLM